MANIEQLIKQYQDKEDIANMQEFYLEKAQDALKAWRDMDIDSNRLDDLINNFDYNSFKNNPNVKDIRDCIFRLVAYCDMNASEKETFNEYTDKRVMAKAGIWQHQWIKQWLIFKKDSTKVSESISNVVNYIDKPKDNFPIVSEEHKEQLARNLLHVPYNKTTFTKQLLKYFDQFGLSCKKDENKTMLYTKILYSSASLWQDKVDIKGLVARDRSNWKDSFESDIAGSPQGYGVMWRDNLPSSSTNVFKALKKRIENDNTFDFYIVEDNWTTYKAVIEDYVLAENYKNIVDEWKSKEPIWFQDKFEDYCDDAKNQHAKVAYLVKSFKKIPIEKRLNIYTNFKLLDNPVRANYVAFTNIITKMDQKISNISELLKLKKNIILQGAPGTGKTYTTASIAVSMCNEGFTDYDNHEEVMKEYESLCKNGQIAFCTFHQSMDYEDFIEGLKPQIKGSNVEYNIQKGIFREICEKAKDELSKNYVLIIDEINRGNVSKIFGELITLLEADKRTGDGEHSLTLKLPYSKEDFCVPSNLYIIGTMNTTDRSTGTIDYAVRRRFAFVTLETSSEVLKEWYKEDTDVKQASLDLFEEINNSFIPNHKVADFELEDLKVGHSYFMAKNLDELKLKMQYEVIPLIKEYQKDGILKTDKNDSSFFEKWAKAEPMQQSSDE